jgi:hypothetical protein
MPPGKNQVQQIPRGKRYRGLACERAGRAGRSLAAILQGINGDANLVEPANQAGTGADNTLGWAMVRAPGRRRRPGSGSRREFHPPAPTDPA